jgi:hypothetical protein
MDEQTDKHMDGKTDGQVERQTGRWPFKKTDS